jgi:hypothetical protein
MGQGVRDGQWYGRPKQEGGIELAIMMFAHFILAIVGAVAILSIFSIFQGITFLIFIGVILALIWFLGCIIAFFVKLGMS